MALLGKILVFVHTGLSLSLAALALALYTNRIDWTERKADANKPAGLLAQRRAEYDRVASNALRPADTRFRNNRQLLAFQEAWRPAEKAWFAQELEHLRSGDASKKQIRQVVRGADGFPIGPEGVTPPDLVQMQWPFMYKERSDPKDPKSPFAEQAKPRKDRSGKDLALNTYTYYRNEMDGVLKEKDKAAQRLQAAANKDKEITDDLKGVPPDKKGLHAELRDEFVKLAMIEAEYDELRPQWLNNKVELQNLEELRERLNERVRQLGGTPVAERPAGQ